MIPESLVHERVRLSKTSQAAVVRVPVCSRRNYDLEDLWMSWSEFLKNVKQRSRLLTTALLCMLAEHAIKLSRQSLSIRYGCSNWIGVKCPWSSAFSIPEPASRAHQQHSWIICHSCGACTLHACLEESHIGVFMLWTWRYTWFSHLGLAEYCCTMPAMHGICRGSLLTSSTRLWWLKLMIKIGLLEKRCPCQHGADY